VKGRDWYDLIWYAANYPDLRLKHLEQRMVQTEDWPSGSPLTESAFKGILIERINTLDINKIRKEVEPFVRAPENLVIWSREFFLDIASRVKVV
jgi:hypothetical protein